MSVPVRPSPPSVFARLSLFWQLQLAGWIGFSFFSLPLKQAIYGSWTASLLITCYQLPLSLALTLLLRLFYHRIRPGRLSPPYAAALLLTGCATAGSIDVLISIPINRFFGLLGPTGLMEPGLYFFRTAIYVIWSLFYFLVKSQLAARQAAFDAAVAEEKLRLQILRYQFNPQFLATSLEQISNAVEEDPAVARATIMRLANFYQTAVHHAESNEPTTLRGELDLIRAYLEIERLRFGDALTIQFQVDEALLSLPLPPLLLLPLAEKAVKYGFEMSPQKLAIWVTAQRTAEGEILLEVARTGRLFDRAGREDLSGNDLLNLRDRLERHYPGRHRFVLTQDSARARATLCLPLTG